MTSIIIVNCGIQTSLNMLLKILNVLKYLVKFFNIAVALDEKKLKNSFNVAQNVSLRNNGQKTWQKKSKFFFLTVTMHRVIGLFT